MTKDTKVQSLIKGRLGAAVLACVSFLCISFGVSPDEQQAATDLSNNIMLWVGQGSVLLSGLLATISKLKE